MDFSKTGRTVYSRGRSLQASQGISGNFCDVDSGEEYWVSGIKKRGSYVHPCERVDVIIDDDAAEEYLRLKQP